MAWSTVSLRRARQCAAGLVVATSLVALVGWIGWGGRAEQLPELVQGFKVNVAVGVGLLALSWLAPRLTYPAAVTAVAIAGLTIVEYATRVHSGLDQLIAADSSGDHGRMRLAAAICLLGLAVARLLVFRAGPRQARAAELIALAVLMVSGVATVGYAFEEAMSGPAAGIGFLPLLSSVSFVVVAAMLLIDTPDGVGVWLATGVDSGALLLRRVLPVSAFAVPVITVLAVLASRFDVVASGISAPIATVAIMVVVTLSLTHTALALRGSDRSRDRATEALTAVNYDLEERVRERAEELRAEHSANDILLERDRIAADMHDHVIQRLYALGMDLERRSARVGFDADATIDGIDSAIADLRRTIHDLRTAPAAHGLEAELRALSEAVGGRFADGSHVTIRGDLDAVSGEVSLHLLAVTREAISNAVRHADARRLEVQLVVDEAGTALTVSDDGRGIPDGIESTSGLRNMRDRAARCGGLATWQPGQPAGTVINWFVPNDDTITGSPGPAISVSDAVAAYAGTATDSPLPDRLAIAADQLSRLLRADALITLSAETDGMHVRSSRGFDLHNSPDGSVFPYAGSLSGHVATTRKPVRVAQVAQAPVALNTTTLTAGFGPTITVPVAAAEAVHGVLVLLRTRDSEPFTSAEEQAAVLFSTCVATLLDQGGRQSDRLANSGHRLTGAQVV